MLKQISAKTGYSKKHGAIVSLYPKIPLKLAIYLLAALFPPEILALFKFNLTSPHLVFEREFYEQTEVPVGSPLSHIIAELYMESFEKKAHYIIPLQPRVYRRYVDDTFQVWQYGFEESQKYITALNGIHTEIQFTG